jgi:hypothetical protein
MAVVASDSEVLKDEVVDGVSLEDINSTGISRL